MIVAFNRTDVSRGGLQLQPHYFLQLQNFSQEKETASGQINICQTLELQRSMNNSLSLTLSLPLLEFNIIQQMHKMSFNQ